MRKRHLKNGWVRNMGPYKFVTQPWEKQVAIFLNGKCIGDGHTYDEARKIAKKHKEMSD